jgi:hypothetical protein
MSGLRGSNENRKPNWPILAMITAIAATMQTGYMEEMSSGIDNSNIFNIELLLGLEIAKKTASKNLMSDL